MYSDLYLQQKQTRAVPKVFILSMVALLAIVTSQIVSWYSITPARASPIKVISQSVGNISDTNATIFFETSEKCQTYLLFGLDPQKLNKSAYSPNETVTNLMSKALHVVNLEDLQSDTKYYYKIVANGKVIQSLGDVPFSFQTNARKTIATSARQPIYGRVVRPDGTGLNQAIVQVDLSTSEGRQVYYSFTKETGEWLVTLPSNVEGSSNLNITVLYEGLKPSHIKTAIDRAAPLPQSIVIGSDYTFMSEGTNVLPASTRREAEKTYSISLLYPEKDAIIPNSRPLFKGFGIPGTQVTIRVNSRPTFEGQVVVNKQGSWTLEPEKPFIAGKYIVMVTIQDNMGKTRILSRSFVIAKSGEQVLGEQTTATPSGTLVPSKPVSPSTPPKISPLPSGNISPTGFMYITATPPPIVITATPGLFISPTGELERAGVEVSIWLPIVGSLLAVFGFFLVRMTSITSHD